MIEISHRRAQSLAEYALILALIAIAAISALLFLSGGLDGSLAKTITTLGG